MSSPPLRVSLSAEEDCTLFEMRTATTVPQRTKDRAEILRLSHRGWKVDQIARHFNWSLRAVRQAIHRWQEQGLGGLWDAPRPGRRPRWQETDIVYLESLLETDPRTYLLADKEEKTLGECRLIRSPPLLSQQQISPSYVLC